VHTRIARSFSSLRQMIAAHFQESQLNLSEDDAARLPWRARVELLRVTDPAQKAALAREFLDSDMSTRALRARIRGMCTRCAPPPHPRMVLRHAENFLKALNAWEDPVYQAYHPVRDVLKLVKRRMERIERLCYCAALAHADEFVRAAEAAASLAPSVHAE